MERNERIDFYKAMLMLGVVWGHCITNLLAGDDNTIGIHFIFRTYDMPMFMLFSGYFLAYSMEKNNWMALVKARTVRIAVPTIFWGLLISKGHLLNGLDCYYFLCAIFFSTLIVITIGKVLIFPLYQTIIFILLTGVLNFVPLYLWNLSYLFPYFALGYLIKIYRVRKPGPALYGGGIFLWIVSLCFWDKSFSIWTTGTYFKPDDTYVAGMIVAFRYFIAIVGMMSIMKIGDILYEYFNTRRTALFNMFIKSGKETLMIYILHAAVLSVVNKILMLIKSQLGYNPLNKNELFLGYILAPVFAITLIFIITWGLGYAKRYKYIRLVCGYKI